MNIFEPRTAFKPFEYPEVVKFKEAIHHSFWLVSEFNFISDIQDFKVKLDDSEREILKRAILAIAQIEVSVKKFWTNLGNKIPKPEIDQVGVTFGSNEVIHADAYSKLLEILGLNDEFSELLNVKQIQDRVDYLTKYLKNTADNSNENFTLTLTLFSLFIENVSLFSQFLIIKSFNKYKNILKDIDNVVSSTMQEEHTHALFGIYLINQIQKEFPDWFGEEFYGKVNRACKKAYLAEIEILDWIFENGELSNLSKFSIIEFIKDRFNQSVIAIGGENVFEVDETKLLELKWFNEELIAETSIDFFHKKSTAYNKKSKPVKAEDLF